MALPGVAVDQRRRPVADPHGQAGQHVGRGRSVAGIEEQQIASARPRHRPVHRVVGTGVGRAFRQDGRPGKVGRERCDPAARAAVLHQPFEIPAGLVRQAVAGSAQAVGMVLDHRHHGEKRHEIYG
jgi:hypothetical protein